jgi:aldehyde:ferredoxin oxidoreductase
LDGLARSAVSIRSRSKADRTGICARDYVTENPLTSGEAETMIEDYYDEQGWDRKTGIPGRTRLEDLGLFPTP